MQLGDVRLDRPTLEDIPALYEIYSDPGVWTHLPSGRHNRLEVTEQMVRVWIESWERDGLGAWIVRDATTGEVLGQVGCWVKRNAFWNLGYRLAVHVHGRGIASAVAEYAIRKAHETNPDLPVVAYLVEHNLASARVVQKMGLMLQYRGPDAGNPDPNAIRLVYADRPLTEAQLQEVLQ